MRGLSQYYAKSRGLYRKTRLLGTIFRIFIILLSYCRLFNKIVRLVRKTFEHLCQFRSRLLSIRVVHFTHDKGNRNKLNFFFFESDATNLFGYLNRNVMIESEIKKR